MPTHPLHTISIIIWVDRWWPAPPTHFLLRVRETVFFVGCFLEVRSSRFRSDGFGRVEYGLGQFEYERSDQLLAVVFKSSPTVSIMPEHATRIFALLSRLNHCWRRNPRGSINVSLLLPSFLVFVSHTVFIYGSCRYCHVVCTIDIGLMEESSHILSLWTGIKFSWSTAVLLRFGLQMFCFRKYSPICTEKECKEEMRLREKDKSFVVRFFKQALLFDIWIRSMTTTMAYCGASSSSSSMSVSLTAYRRVCAASAFQAWESRGQWLFQARSEAGELLCCCWFSHWDRVYSPLVFLGPSPHCNHRSRSISAK